MRIFLHFLTLVALLVAPLAAPAAAMAPVQSSVECRDMAMAEHQMPAGKHSASDPCCAAVPCAVAMLSAATEPFDPVDHLPFQSLSQAFRLGAGPAVDDPPPRRA